MILLDLNINQERLTFLPYSGFTYKSVLSLENYVQPSAYSSAFKFTYNETKITITTVRIGAIIFDKKNTLQECLDDPVSYFFDFDNQLLYTHFDNYMSPYGSLVGTLKAASFANSLYITSQEQSYLPLLESRVIIKKKADLLKYNKMSFQRQNVTLNNGMGDFDSFFNDPVPSATATIKYLDDKEVDEFGYNKNGIQPKEVYTGIVSADEITTESFKLKLEDIRKQQSITIPRSYITSDDYVNIDDDNDGKILATGYGTCRGIPAVCTNGKVKSGNVEYVFADYSSSISQIYVENDNYWTPVTPVSTSSGGFVLSATDARNDQGDPKKAKCTATLKAQTNPADIIQDLNDRYLQVAFDTSEYNLTEWNSEKALLQNVSLLINKENDIFKYIELLQGGSNYGFVYDIEGDGRRTIRVDYANRAPVRTVQEIEMLEKEKPNERDFTEYAAEVQVRYNKDYEGNTYYSVIDTTYQEEAIKDYNKIQRETVETLLVDKSHAEARALLLAKELKSVKSRQEISVKESWQYDIKLFDILNVNFGYDGEFVGYRNGKKVFIHSRDYIGLQRVQVIGLDYDLLNNIATFTLIQKEEV